MTYFRRRRWLLASLEAQYRFTNIVIMRHFALTLSPIPSYSADIENSDVYSHYMGNKFGRRTCGIRIAPAMRYGGMFEVTACEETMELQPTFGIQITSATDGQVV